MTAIWVLIIVTATLACVLTIPSAAQASRIRECATAGRVVPAAAPRSAAVRLVNVTTRSVDCYTARRFARAFTLRSGPESGFTCSEDFYCRWRGWYCRNDGRHRRYTDHRCEYVTPTRTRVVRWQEFYP